MSQWVNITGQRYGLLVVVSLNSPSGPSGSTWNCVCDCGAARVVTRKALNAKVEPTRSCGCLKNRPRAVDLVGRRFGRLVVLERSGADACRGSRWLCRCDCGNTKVVAARLMKGGRISSCGCLKSLDMSRRFRKHGLSGTPDGFRQAAAQRRARLLGCGGTFSESEVRDLYARQRGRCVYCREKVPLDNVHRDHVMPLALGGANDIANIQLLCPLCNRRKGARHPVVFARRMGLLL